MVQYNRKLPCNACPFRPNSLPGWLGDYAPAEIIDCIRYEIPFYCHQEIENLPQSGTIDLETAQLNAEANGYDMEDWRMHLDAINHCAGALIMAKKMAKLPRDRRASNAVKNISLNAPVFQTPEDFIDYHTKKNRPERQPLNSAERNKTP